LAREEEEEEEEEIYEKVWEELEKAEARKK
jgi:hypothetical protein